MKILAHKTIGMLVLGLAATVLAACGTTPGGSNLVGVAGQPTATAAPSVQVEASPEPPTPTAPESTGHIIFVSDRDGIDSL